MACLIRAIGLFAYIGRTNLGFTYSYISIFVVKEHKIWEIRCVDIYTISGARTLESVYMVIGSMHTM